MKWRVSPEFLKDWFIKSHDKYFICEEEKLVWIL